MNKRHYPWWGHVKAIIRAYPGQMEGEALMENEFPKRLQKLREKERKSRVVLSQLCGLPDTAIQKYERGESKPTMDSLIAIADHFSVSIDYLVGRTNY